MIINQLCEEKFEENKNFKFSKNEIKIINDFQFLTKYMVQSINKLTREGDELNMKIIEQIQNNKNKEEDIKLKKDKIEEQEKMINEFRKERDYLENIIKKLNSQEKLD